MTNESKHLDYLKHFKSKDFQYKVNIMKPLRVGTDCSGIEAPLQALNLLNIPYKHIFSCDNDPHVVKSIKANHNPKYIYDNIFERDHKELPLLDFYVSGFPCQTFSTLGKRAGFADTRGTIFFQCYTTIKCTKPKFFILENVKGLINHDKGKTFEIILDELKKLKTYNVYWKLFNTKNYGVPQSRERIYIVGIDKKLDNGFRFPKEVSLDITVADIIENYDNIDPKFGYLTEHKTKLINELQENKKVVDLDKNWSMNLNVSNYKRCGPMLDICPTLLAGNGGDCIFYLSSIKRRYTPREYLNLQGFGEFNQDVSNSKLYKQVGNSMSVNILAFLFKSIILTTDL
jgi:DNA (cytosine-5)-methyltransferase 1